MHMNWIEMGTDGSPRLEDGAYFRFYRSSTSNLYTYACGSTATESKMELPVCKEDLFAIFEDSRIDVVALIDQSS